MSFKKENLALLVMLTAFCQAVKADTTTTTTSATTSVNTSPATVLTKSDGSVETIWWVPSTTNSYWTPEWWSEYTAAGGKLASVSTTTTDSDSTSSSTSSTSTSSTTTSYPGTTTTGSAYVSGDANGHTTTITPIIDIYTTTDSNGKTETISSTISSSTSTSTSTSASVVSSGGANLGVVAMLNEQQGLLLTTVFQTLLMLVVGLV